MLTSFSLIIKHTQTQSLYTTLHFQSSMIRMHQSLRQVTHLSTSRHGRGDTDNYPPDLRSKSLVLVKVWCLLIVFVVTLAAGVSPYLLKWNATFLVLGTQFAGGVFLGTAFMDFLRASSSSFDKLTSKDYPFAFMLACFGYLFAMLADRIVHYVHRKRSGSERGHLAVQATRGVQQRKSGSSDGASTSQVQVPDIGIDHYIDPSIFAANSITDSFLLILALCFHSVYEGIAIGLVDTSSRAWRVLWTVSLHKVFAAIAMGLAILQMIPDSPLLSCIPYAFALAISTPIGAAIGIVIDASTQGLAADWIYAISMGFSCGVFIYISIHHLIISEGRLPLRTTTVDTHHHKFLAVLLGVIVISVVMIWDA